jgi:hypothetical protein
MNDMKQKFPLPAIIALAATLGLVLLFSLRATDKPFIEPVKTEYVQPTDGTPVPEPAVAERPGLIRVDSLKPGDVVASPLTITGEARGTWYFEASFPAHLLDADGKELAVLPVQAQGEWMTEDYVPFKATLYFTAPTTPTGTLVLKKDNPSGLPEHDDELRIPVRFAPAAPGPICRPTGCSGQVCADEDVVTTCEFRESYGCYKDALCERRPDGKCGWTETPTLAACLKAAGL